MIKSYPAPVRMLLFLLSLAAIWLPGALAIYLTIASSQNIKDPYVANNLTILTMGLLAIEFIIFLPIWGRRVYGIDRFFNRVGLSFSRQNSLFFTKGLVIGLFSTFFLFGVQYALGLVSYHPAKLPLWQLILEGSLSGLGVAFAEELFFRGWMLTELERDYAPRVALIIDGLIFAILHFIKPIQEIIAGFPIFPGLWLFGTLMIIGKRAHHNLLGIAIGLHGGMVWAFYIINVGQIFRSTNRISDWITGIGGHPVAGLMGIIGLLLMLPSIYNPHLLPWTIISRKS